MEADLEIPHEVALTSFSALSYSSCNQSGTPSWIGAMQKWAYHDQRALRFFTELSSCVAIQAEKSEKWLRYQPVFTENWDDSVQAITVIFAKTLVNYMQYRFLCKSERYQARSVSRMATGAITATHRERRRWEMTASVSIHPLFTDPR